MSWFHSPFSRIPALVSSSLSSGSVFFHLVALCTYVLEGQGRASARHSPAVRTERAFQHIPLALYRGGFPVVAGWFSLVGTAHACSMECRQGKKKTCLWPRPHCRPAVWFSSTRFILLWQLVTEWGRGVIPVQILSGVCWRPNIKLDVQVPWEFTQWIAAYQKASWILSLLPTCGLPVSNLLSPSSSFSAP